MCFVWLQTIAFPQSYERTEEVTYPVASCGLLCALGTQ